MRERLESIKDKIKDFWQTADKNKKIYLAVGMVLFLVIVTLLILKFTTPKYELLYGDLTLKDVGEITGKLDDMGIAWKTGTSDHSILVARKDKSRAKIELATEGLPKESGYSVIDAFGESSWTMTDYDKKQRMKHALQSELANTISEIDGIKNAKVYIEEREKNNFVLSDEENKKTASVFLVKDPRYNLDNDKVLAIKNLVSGAVNIKLEDVIIIDNEARLLDGVSDNDGLGSGQYKVKTEIEGRINQSLKKFLGNVYGYNNVDILSSVKINLDSEKRLEQIFSPPIEGSEEGIVRSTEEVDESMVGGSIGGAPGTVENVEDYPMEDGQTSDSYNKASRIINNEINEINREIMKSPGQVESITVAVLINEKSLPGGEMTLDKEEEITNLIYAATGLDTKDVQIIAEEFNEESFIDDFEETSSGFNKGIILAILAAIIVVFLLIFFLRKKETEKEEKELEEVLLKQKLEERYRDDEDLDFDMEESKMKRQIDKFITEKPEAATQLLRSWLNE